MQPLWRTYCYTPEETVIGLLLQSFRKSFFLLSSYVSLQHSQIWHDFWAQLDGFCKRQMVIYYHSWLVSFFFRYIWVWNSISGTRASTIFQWLKTKIFFKKAIWSKHGTPVLFFYLIFQIPWTLKSPTVTHKSQWICRFHLSEKTVVESLQSCKLIMLLSLRAKSNSYWCHLGQSFYE